MPPVLSHSDLKCSTETWHPVPSHAADASQIWLSIIEEGEEPVVLVGDHSDIPAAFVATGAASRTPPSTRIGEDKGSASPAKIQKYQKEIR